MTITGERLAGALLLALVIGSLFTCMRARTLLPQEGCSSIGHRGSTETPRTLRRFPRRPPPTCAKMLGSEKGVPHGDSEAD
jgi:hypothetical protein